jgi:aspartate/methionine/tyrosine aminotransferase
MTLPRTAATFPPPVMEARRWIAGQTFSADRPLIIVSQAAPVDPPPDALRQHIAETALSLDSAHLYGPVLGLPALRAEVASQFSAAYGGQIDEANVCITAGCNQAFCAAMMTLTTEGDEVILPTPYYFNHKMWLDMTGARSVDLPTGHGLLPDPDVARAMISDRTRAIVLVTPNNPAGVEYPADLVAAFRDVAREAGIALIVDETYRDFHSQSGAPHDLFTDPDWDDTVIQLYSFSKAYRLTGHRVGAMIAHPDRLAQVERFLDTVTICPNQLAQHAALWGMQNLGQWLAGERAEILDRRAAIQDGFPKLAEKGGELLGVGAYFDYVAHPFRRSSLQLAQDMVTEAAVLALPGTMFMPPDDPAGQRQLRIAFANIDRAGINTLFERLAALAPRNVSS